MLSLYLGLAPVYQLPGVPDEGLRLLKAVIVSAAVIIVLAPPLLSGRLHLPGWLLGPLGFIALILLSAPGLVQAREPHLVVMFVMDIGYAAGFMWCFFWLARQGENVSIIFIRALVLFAALAAAAFIIVLVEVPDWNSPCEEWWRPVYNSGFGTSRTGWSIGSSLFLPVAVLLAGARPHQPSLCRTASAMVVAGVIICAQFVSGGRAGLMASLFSVIVLVFLDWSRWLALLVVAGIIVIGGVLVDESCFKHLRLERLPAPSTEHPLPTATTPSAITPSATTPSATTPNQSSPASQTTVSLDYVSGGRMNGYKTALKRISERPFLGHGLEQVLVPGVTRPQVEIHNLWLKWAVYSGILAPLCFIVMVGYILRMAFGLFASHDRTTENRRLATSLGLILLSGILAAMLEPGALIGAFQYTAIWWAAAGSLAGLYSKESNRRDWRVPFPFKLGHRGPSSAGNVE